MNCKTESLTLSEYCLPTILRSHLTIRILQQQVMTDSIASDPFGKLHKIKTFRLKELKKLNNEYDL